MASKHTRGWQPMSTAPKDKVILVSETPNGEHFNVLQAYWGTPKGFPEPGWWGITFAIAHSFGGDASALDKPELRSRLIVITPICWKPMPKVRKRPIVKKRYYHYAIMTEKHGGEQQGCATAESLKAAEKNVDEDCIGLLRKIPKKACKVCNE